MNQMLRRLELKLIRWRLEVKKPIFHIGGLTTITINGENAAQAIEEFAALSASFIPGSSMESKTFEEPKVTRQRKSTLSKKEESTKPDKEEEKSTVIDSTPDDDDKEFSEPEHTLVELRALAKEITTADKSNTPKVKKILTEFGYANVSAVEDRDIDKIYAELEELNERSSAR